MIQAPRQLRLPSIISLCLLATAFLAGCVAPPASPGTGTLQGHVSIGPVQPMVRADEPALTVPPEAYAARQLIIVGTGEQTAVYRVQIGPDGAYKVALPPGTYTVDLSRVGMDFSKDLPATVEIVAGQNITLDVDVDTGIR
jgi:hypothetical protein